MRRSAELVALLFLFFVLAGTAQGQILGDEADENSAVALDDLGLTLPLAKGARPAGMAGAYTALGGDVHSLVYNPAGLAELKRIDLTLSFQHQRHDYRMEFFDSGQTLRPNSTTLDALAVGYPFPTYRGSLVAAFGIYREHAGTLEIFYDALNTIPPPPRINTPTSRRVQSTATTPASPSTWPPGFPWARVFLSWTERSPSPRGSTTITWVPPLAISLERPTTAKPSSMPTAMGAGWGSNTTPLLSSASASK